MPVYTIGVGSTEPRRNLAVSDLLVPARAFPGDTVNIVGYIQATGYAGRFVDVELLRRDRGRAGRRRHVDRFATRADRRPTAKIVPVSFDIEPDAPGRFVYQIRAAAPPDDDNPRDNGRESEMDVVDRQTRVLLLASGPTREYRFLRDQLHRDKTMKSDVLLQTGSDRHVAGRGQHPRPTFPRRAKSSINTTASSRSIPIGRSSTPRKSSCSRNGSPKKRAA